MDPEPGRCRRTDGKKWRCSRDVLSDQKYCERHMHRGRQRSRKHVEVTENILKSNSDKTVNSNKTRTIKPHDTTKKNSNLSLQFPASLQPIGPSSNTSDKVCSAATPVSTTSSHVNSRNNGNANVKNDSSARSTYITTYNGSNESFKIKRSSRNILSNSNNGTVASGFDFPPKSVLRRGVGCDTSGRALTETEPQRCRRTDGRKWRCSGDVLPEQKYCLQHMHRGVKKLIAPSDSVTVALSPPPLAMPKKTDSGINVNTGLSITPVSSHRILISDDETTSTSGSSSDATTITDDENTSDSSKFIVRARTSDV